MQARTLMLMPACTWLCLRVHAHTLALTACALVCSRLHYHAFALTLSCLHMPTLKMCSFSGSLALARSLTRTLACSLARSLAGSLTAWCPLARSLVRPPAPLLAPFAGLPAPARPCPARSGHSASSARSACCACFACFAHFTCSLASLLAPLPSWHRLPTILSHPSHARMV